MKPVALFAKALTLENKEQLVIKYAIGSEFSGEVRLTKDVFFLDEKRKEQVRKVLRMIGQYVTETYVI